MIYILWFGSCALESARSEIKHLDTWYLNTLNIKTIYEDILIIKNTGFFSKNTEFKNDYLKLNFQASEELLAKTKLDYRVLVKKIYYKEKGRIVL